MFALSFQNKGKGCSGKREAQYFLFSVEGIGLDSWVEKLTF